MLLEAKRLVATIFNDAVRCASLIADMLLPLPLPACHSFCILASVAASDPAKLLYKRFCLSSSFFIFSTFPLVLFCSGCALGGALLFWEKKEGVERARSEKVSALCSLDWPREPSDYLLLFKKPFPFCFFLVAADLCDDAYKTWNQLQIEKECGPNDGEWGKGCKVNAKTYDDDEKWSCDDWCKAQGLACGAAAYEKTKDSCERKDDDAPKCSTRTETKRKICTCVVPDCTTSCCPSSWDNVKVTCGAPKDCRAVIKTDSTFSYETCTTFCSKQQGGMECVASYDDKDDDDECPDGWSNNKGCDHDFKEDRTSDAVCECKMPSTSTTTTTTSTATS